MAAGPITRNRLCTRIHVCLCCHISSHHWIGCHHSTSTRTVVAMKLRVKLVTAPAVAATRLEVATDTTVADFKAIIKASLPALDSINASSLKLSLNKKASAGAGHDGPHQYHFYQCYHHPICMHALFMLLASRLVCFTQSQALDACTLMPRHRTR